MKSIKYEDYNINLGTLINIEDVVSFKEHHVPEAINIPYKKLIYNYEKLLDKNKKYYIMCHKNVLSKKLVSILDFYGYNVTQLTK